MDRIDVQDAINMINEFGLYHTIDGLPYYIRTSKVYEKVILGLTDYNNLKY